MSDGFSKFKKGIQLDPQSADPSNPAEGDQFYSDGTSRAKGMWQYKDGAWAEFGGAGSSGINYMVDDNNNAENGIGDWVTYADAAGENAVDGTGGTALYTTFTQNTTTPLRDTADFKLAKTANNAQGEGASCAFTIDKADKAKKQTISFDYDASHAGYADDDIRLSVYDVTNATLIRINGEDLKGGKGTHYAQFQTASDSTSYRLIAHVSSTNATAYDVFFDNVKVGPTNLAFGTIVTDWESTTPVVKGTTADPILGTTGITNLSYRRVGDSLEGNVSIYQSAAGTNGTGSYYIQLPNGLTIDSTKYPFNTSSTPRKNLGDAAITVNGTRYEGTSILQESSGSFLGISAYIFNDVSGIGEWNAGTHPFNTGTYDIQMTFTVPIQGWSSNAKMSEDLGGREIVVSAYSNGNETIGANTAIPFSTTGRDTTGSWSGTEFTVPETGDYHVDIILHTVAKDDYYGIWVNGSNDGWVGKTDNNDIVNGNKTLYLLKDDVISVRFNASTTLVTGTNHRINITKFASPQTQLETEREAVRVTCDSGLTVTAGSPIIFNNIITSDSGSYNSSTGVYTVNKNGIISGSVKVKPSSSSVVEIGIEVNGTEVEVFEAGTTANSVTVPFEVPVSKGDTFEITNSAGSSLTLTSSALNNVLTFHRVK